MDLDARQSRGLFLAGTVPFPTPFPSMGTIALDVGQFTYSQGQPPHAKDLVLVLEFDGNRTVARIMLQDDVSAFFIPGFRDANGAFQISHAAQVGDLDEGEWFLNGDINAATVRQCLGLGQQDDISTRSSILRGIVFIAEDSPILRTTEIFCMAGEDEELQFPCCTCEYEPFPERLRTSCTQCFNE